MPESPIPRDLAHLVDAPFADVRTLLEALAADPRGDDAEHLNEALHDRTFRFVRDGTRGEIAAEIEARGDFLASRAWAALQKGGLGDAIELRSMARQLKRALADAPADEEPPEPEDAERERRREILREAKSFERDAAGSGRAAGRS